MTRRQMLICVVLVGLLLVAATAAWMRRSFQHQIDAEVAALRAAATPVGKTVAKSDLAPLPAPVQRWLRASGVVGTEVPTLVRLTQEGEFRLGADKPWMPMTATQHYSINPPGFVWEVSMRMYPLVQITGRDRYADGTGEIEMRIASIIPVASKSGGNLNSGALLRYLNETMWFPAALVLPNVAWEPIDDRSARATITDAGQSVSAVFHFDEQDRLVNMTADRWNDSEQAMLPWSTPMSDWGEFAGLQLATAGAGVWKTGANAYEYIRLRVTAIDYAQQ